MRSRHFHRVIRCSHTLSADTQFVPFARRFRCVVLAFTSILPSFVPRSAHSIDHRGTYRMVWVNVRVCACVFVVLYTQKPFNHLILRYIKYRTNTIEPLSHTSRTSTITYPHKCLARNVSILYRQNWKSIMQTISKALQKSFSMRLNERRSMRAHDTHDSTNRHGVLYSCLVRVRWLSPSMMWLRRFLSSFACSIGKSEWEIVRAHMHSHSRLTVNDFCTIVNGHQQTISDAVRDH